MIIDVGYWTRILKNILMLIISVVLIFLAFKLAIFYIPFLIGFIISLLVEPLIKRISKKTSIERKKVAIFVLVVIFGILLGLLAWGIVSLITESSNLMQKFNGYIELIYDRINEILQSLKNDNSKIPVQIITIIENSTDTIVSFISKYISNLLGEITQIISQIPVIGIYIVITVLATYFICTDKMYIRDALEHQLPNRWAKKIGVHVSDIARELGNYLKAEIILVTISFFIVLIGLYILKFIGFNVPYPLLSAIRNRLCRCSANTWLRNSNDTLGYNCRSKRRYKTWYCNYNYFCYYTNCKTNDRTKNCKQQNWNSSNFYSYCNVYRI